MTPSSICPCGDQQCTSTEPLVDWHTSAPVTKDGTVIQNDKPFVLHPQIADVLSGLSMIPAKLDDASHGNTGYIDRAQPHHLLSLSGTVIDETQNGVFIGKDKWNRSFAALVFTDNESSDPTQRHVVTIFQRYADNEMQFMWATEHTAFSSLCRGGQSMVDWEQKPLEHLRTLVAGTHQRFSLCL